MEFRRCCFTGHRQIPAAALAPLTHQLDLAILAVYNMGVREFYTGGAVGFDTLAAERVLFFRATHPDVRLVLLLPCRNQYERWPKEAIRRYREILAAADHYRYISEFYSDAAMRERNMALVRNTDICLAFVTHDASGAGQTMRAAERAGKSVVNLAGRIPPELLQ